VARLLIHTNILVNEGFVITIVTDVQKNHGRLGNLLLQIKSLELVDQLRDSRVFYVYDVEAGEIVLVGELHGLDYGFVLAALRNCEETAVLHVHEVILSDLLRIVNSDGIENFKLLHHVSSI